MLECTVSIWDKLDLIGFKWEWITVSSRRVTAAAVSTSTSGWRWSSGHTQIRHLVESKPIVFREPKIMSAFFWSIRHSGSSSTIFNPAHSTSQPKTWSNRYDETCPLPLRRWHVLRAHTPVLPSHCRIQINPPAQRYIPVPFSDAIRPPTSPVPFSP